MVEDKTMTEINHLYCTKSENLAHSTKLCSTNHHRTATPLIGKQEEIHLKVALSLATHINWRTKQLKHNAYSTIAEELNTFGVSKYYVGAFWRKHKQDTLDTVN
jgi:hypothetical protein